jgi:hypothetical protein
MQWTADTILRVQERFMNWRLASAAGSRFRHIIEVSPHAFWAALETASPWASPGDSVSMLMSFPTAEAELKS